jgi:hypothetical protein
MVYARYHVVIDYHKLNRVRAVMVHIVICIHIQKESFGNISPRLSMLLLSRQTEQCLPHH